MFKIQKILLLLLIIKTGSLDAFNLEINDRTTGHVLMKGSKLEFNSYYYNPNNLPYICSNIMFEEYKKLLQCSDCQKRSLQNHPEIRYMAYHEDIHRWLLMKYAESDLKELELLPKEAETLALLQEINPDQEDQVVIQKNIDLVEEKFKNLNPKIQLQKMLVIKNKLETRSQSAEKQKAALIRKGSSIDEGQKQALRQLEKCIRRTDKRIEDLGEYPEWAKKLYKNLLLDLFLPANSQDS